MLLAASDNVAPVTNYEKRTTTTTMHRDVKEPLGLKKSLPEDIHIEPP